MKLRNLLARPCLGAPKYRDLIGGWASTTLIVLTAWISGLVILAVIVAVSYAVPTSAVAVAVLYTLVCGAVLLWAYGVLMVQAWKFFNRGSKR